MTLSDLASLASVVSGLAVLVSLVFLYFQMRQMGEQQKQAERNQHLDATRSSAGRGRRGEDRDAQQKARITTIAFGKPAEEYE